MFSPTEPRTHAAHPPVGANASPEIRSSNVPIYFGIKRGVDTVSALLLLFITAPIILLAMIVVKLSSRGPAVYQQTRVGLLGKPFTIYKIRTMVHECENLTGARWATPGDARITPIGRFLRKTHIDELPQLWNVLRGDMSLVGPRPERPEFLPHLEQALPRYRERLLVRPGVTGLAQVQFPPDTDLGSVKTKLAYDLYYVRNIGFGYDMRIYWATVLKMMGSPFRVIRLAFGFPTREAIDEEYQNRLPPPPPPTAHPKDPAPLAEGEPVPVLS
jgi:lipopolysaccharide/colanic/teichoic acid biosynthesis glycosyltransferase